MAQSNNAYYFSKFLFKTGLQCPSRLFYHKKGFSQSRESDPFIAHSRFNKKQLTQLLRLRFPSGSAISESNKQEAAQKTASFLEEDNAVVFDGVVTSNSCFAKYPVIVKKYGAIDFYQVHTKAFNPEKHSLYNHYGQLHAKWKSYLTGLSYQYYLLHRCFPEYKISAHLVLPNKFGKLSVNNYKNLKDNNLRFINDSYLLHVEDVSQEVKQIIKNGVDTANFAGSSFGKTLVKLVDIYFADEQYPIELGKKCQWCEFRLENERVEKGEKSGFDQCWQKIRPEYQSEGLVFDLIGPGRGEWIDRNIYLQKNVPNDELVALENIIQDDNSLTARHRQSLQILKTKGKKVPDEIIKPKLIDELDRWRYPLHFLDFEAGNYAVPIRPNRHPYHLVLFQYSCHTLRSDGSWQHHQWLDPIDGTYPNYALLENLRMVPDILNGTIIQYSNFEYYALKTIRKELKREEDPPSNHLQLREWLDKVIEGTTGSGQQVQMADISGLVKKYYYNYRMGNSLSIKEVLQAIMEVSPFLKETYSKPYNSHNFAEKIWWQKEDEGIKKPHDLLSDEEGAGVRRGTEAMVAYANMRENDYSDEKHRKICNNLLKYCELDTLAILMIYQHWKHSV